MRFIDLAGQRFVEKRNRELLANSLIKTHAQLVLDITQYLRLMRWLVLVTPRGGIPGAPGWSDLIAFRHGRVMFVEVKVGRDALSVDQLRVRAELEARGFEVLEARSLDDVMRVAA